MNYKWRLSELNNVEKNGYRVFSCFSCGGEAPWDTSLQDMK